MKVSIVIPLYNKKTYIRRAICSVLAQTYPDFELIVINDGSTDNSLEEAQKIIDPRIRIVSQENRGTSAARNRGVRESRNDWVAFLDADDEWLPEFLEKMVGLTLKYPHCGLYGTAHYRVVNKSFLTVSVQTSELTFGWEGVFDNYFNSIGEVLPYCSSSVFISKEKLLKVGGFPENIRYWEDTDTWMRLALHYDAAFLNIPLSIYHTEVKNRTEAILTDHEKILERWAGMLISDQIPSRYRSSFREFIARYQIMIARSYLARHRPQLARKILPGILLTSKYYETAKKLTRWSKYPSLVSRIILGIYYRLTSYANKIAEYLGIR